MPPRYESMLRQCRLNFTHDDRKLRSWRSRRYLRIARPKWCSDKDGLRVLFDGWRSLYANGQIVWGRVVAADEDLYHSGRRDGRATVIFPAEPRANIQPRILRESAERLFELRFNAPDDFELKGIANALADNRRRIFGLSVPRRMAPAVQLLLSSTVLLRRHMPERVLGAEIMPLIVKNNWPRLAIMLPSVYWPSELVQLWHDGEEGVGGKIAAH